MSAASIILDRLERVRQTRPGNWAAACPCCESRRGRPISVRELDDGRVLLHAFCGCDTEAVLSRIGLALGDLFDAPLSHHIAPSRSRISARDLLALIDTEVLVALIVLNAFAEARAVDEQSWHRLALAASRIATARHHGRC